MADVSPLYSKGTVSVANGGTTVTGVGTSFNTALLRAGDIFFKSDLSAGSMITAEPTGPNSLAIEAWPSGALAAGSNYKILRLSDAVRFIDATAQFLQALVPNLTAFGALTGAADKAPYFTGAGAFGTTDLKTVGRALMALSGGANGKIPVITGTNSAALRDIFGTVGQSGGVPTGALMEYGSNANGDYWRFANRLQLCIATIDDTAAAWATAAGSTFVRSSTLEWVYPASFSGSLGVWGSTYRGDSRGGGVHLSSLSSTAAQLLPWTSSTINADVYKILRVISVGRWF